MTSRIRLLSTVLGAAALLTVAANVTASTFAAEQPEPTPAVSVEAARAALTQLTVPGTSWSQETATGRFVVTYDDTVVGESMTRLRAITDRLGSTVTVVREPGVLLRRSSGDGMRTGDPVDPTHCTLAFSGSKGDSQERKAYFITAGHCGVKGVKWYGSDKKLVGTIIESTFPGADHALGEYAPGAARANVINLDKNKVQDISHAGTATVGQRVTRKGQQTGIHTGKVLALNVTVNYAQGSVTGLIKTDVCAAKGDSGGPLFDGTAALGVLSGGKGNCDTGGFTFYQPIGPALAAYGVKLY